MIAFALTSCDPAPPPSDPAGADIDIDVGRSGEARIDLALAPALDADLVALTEVIAAAALPGRQATISEDGNGGGYAYGTAEFPAAYETGPQPSFAIGVPRGALDALHEAGVRQISVQLCLPVGSHRVVADQTPDEDIAGCWLWTMTTSGPPLGVEVTLHTGIAAWGWSLVAAAITVVSGALAALALRRRPVTRSERRRAAALATPGVLAFAIGSQVRLEGPHADAFAIAGTLSGVGLRAAGLVPLVFVVCGAWCVTAVLLAFAMGRNAKPGDAELTPRSDLPENA